MIDKSCVKIWIITMYIAKILNKLEIVNKFLLAEDTFMLKIQKCVKDISDLHTVLVNH